MFGKEISFTKNLLSLNESLADFKRWEFLAGMKFLDDAKWWGDFGKRATPHEGLDLKNYTDTLGKSFELPVSIKIPAVFTGEVVSVFSDFLGETILLKHDLTNEEGWCFYSAMGHVELIEDINVGDFVNSSQPIAHLALPQRSIISSHLHLSIFWLNPELAAAQINWDVISSSSKINLVDPIKIL